ncbi:MAG: DUF3392 family protein [Fibrobacter sp.]|nr:DUF3392 family protein [Fibrobacter sp.]
MQTWIHEIANFVRDHLPSISVGIVSTALVIYGASINKFFRKLTRKTGVILRFVLFVLLCSFGYGFVSSQAVKWLNHTISSLKDVQLLVVVFGAFLVLGFLAKQGREI